MIKIMLQSLFTHEESEAQRGSAICPRLPAPGDRILIIYPGSLACESHSLSLCYDAFHSSKKDEGKKTREWQFLGGLHCVNT